MIASRSSRPLVMLSNATTRKCYSSSETHSASQVSELKSSWRPNRMEAWIHYKYLKSSTSNLSGEQLGQSVMLAVTGLSYLTSLALRYGQRNSNVVARGTRSLQGKR
ncbi:hypothetical protein MHU86_6012 [Fragilaria crotonensis]|nr:hypothetical protein MHU86_6012 [Fragilaria crotonensis]